MKFNETHQGYTLSQHKYVHTVQPNLQPVQNTAFNVLLLKFDQFGFPSSAQISPIIAADKIA